MIDNVHCLTWLAVNIVVIQDSSLTIIAVEEMMSSFSASIN